MLQSIANSPVRTGKTTGWPPAAQTRLPALSSPQGDLVRLRFAGYTSAEKKKLLASAPVIFTDGANPGMVAASQTQASRLIREAALSALKEGQLAYAPKVKGPLAEGWGGAAIVESAPGQHIKLTDSNINYRTDIKICAEQNLLDRIIKYPAVLTGKKPQIKLMTNILYNFDQDRYHNKHLVPCDSCLDTMQAVYLNRPGLLSPETLISSVVTENINGKKRVLIEVRPLKALLPMMGKTQPSFPTVPIAGMPIETSDAARKLMAQRQQAPISDEHIRSAMQQALIGFAESVLHRKSERSNEYLGTGLMIYPDTPGGQPMFSHGSSLHIKNSEPAYPELDALNNLLTSQPGTSEYEQLQAILQNPALIEEKSRPVVNRHLKDKKEMKPLAENLAMLGFVHRQNDQPRPRLLGLMRSAAGGKDFLVGLIRDNRIQVLSSSDLLPIQYKDSRQPQPASKASRQGLFSRVRTWFSETFRAILARLRSWFGRGPS